jgi:hypothetical protein
LELDKLDLELDSLLDTLDTLEVDFELDDVQIVLVI